MTDEQYRQLQNQLVRQPSAGAVIQGTGGLRKLRWGGSGRGKRGGTRVIYFWHSPSSRLVMLFAFRKNERDDLSAAQRKALREIIKSEYP
jgi:mRNA-degrading endonuclease RelE of RelBE toxin-antitoxin system